MTDDQILDVIATLFQVPSVDKHTYARHLLAALRDAGYEVVPVDTVKRLAIVEAQLAIQRSIPR